ncbi:YfhO family protein [Candidatus Roizmanbacteria bacterium]|nr:YfhO family protein [Candidatus Roizmanbacteria bacterium]
MKKEFFISVVLFLIITLIFFYPILKGKAPFPGDLLVGNYSPYNSNSYFSYAPGGVPNKAQGPDVIKEAFPWKVLVIDQFKKGQLPYWTPYNFAGNPVMANFQSAVFYPGNIIFLLLPFINAWTIFIFLGLFLAGLFTYLFLRELQIGKLPSIFGGIIFAFSSYMVVWVEYGNITHTYLWLPLVLFFTERLIKSFTKKSLIFLILVLLLSLSGGYIQGYFYIYATTAFYFLIKSKIEKTLNFKKALLFLLVITSPFALFLFQLFPTLANFKNSSRGEYSLQQIDTLLNPLWYTITTVIPNFFGHPAARNHWFSGTYIERVSYFGLIPLVLAIAALSLFKKVKEIVIFGCIFIASFFLATNFFINKFFYLLPIPVFSTTVPTRILSLFVFFGSILAAYGLELFLQKKYQKNFLISIIGVSIVVLGSLIFVFVAPKIFSGQHWLIDLSITKRNLLLPIIFVLSFWILYFTNYYSSKFFKKFSVPSFIIGGLFIFITVIDLFYFFHKITPFAPKEYVYPQTEVIKYLQNKAGLFRFWGYGAAYIPSNFQAVDRTFSPEGEDPLHLRWYTELISATTDGKVPAVLARTDANLASGYGPGQFENNKFRQKIINLVGVKYILNKDNTLGAEYRPDNSTFSDKNYKLVWQQSPWQVYENLNVLPRAFLVKDFKLITDNKLIVKTLFDQNFDIGKTIILNENSGIGLNNKLKINGKVEIISYTPNKVIVTVSSDAPALLFLSDTYSNSWKAKIDGINTKVYKADYAFRAVPVMKGKHTIIFEYDSNNFDKGIVYSGIFAVILSLFLLKINLKKL